MTLLIFKRVAVLIGTATLFICASCKQKQQVEFPTPAELKQRFYERDLLDKQIKTELRILNTLEEGMARAQKEDKPILLCFTGYAVVNSKKMEANILGKNEVLFKLLKNEFVNVWLYFDDKRTGKEAYALQKELVNTNIQPTFVFLDKTGNKISDGYDFSDMIKEDFIEQLRLVL